MCVHVMSMMYAGDVHLVELPVGAVSITVTHSGSPNTGTLSKILNITI